MRLFEDKVIKQEVGFCCDMCGRKSIAHDRLEGQRLSFEERKERQRALYYADWLEYRKFVAVYIGLTSNTEEFGLEEAHFDICPTCFGAVAEFIRGHKKP